MAPNSLLTDLLRSPVAPRPAAPTISTSNSRTSFQDYLETIRAPQNIPTPPTGDPGPTRPRPTDNPSAAAVDVPPPTETRPPAEPKSGKTVEGRPSKKSQSKSDDETATNSESMKASSSAEPAEAGGIVEAKPASPEAIALQTLAGQTSEDQANSQDEQRSSEKSTAIVASNETIKDASSSRSVSTDSGKTLISIQQAVTTKVTSQNAPRVESTDQVAEESSKDQKAVQSDNSQEDDTEMTSSQQKAAATNDLKAERSASSAAGARITSHTAAATRPFSETKSERKHAATNDSNRVDSHASVNSQKVKIDEANRADQESSQSPNSHSDTKSRSSVGPTQSDSTARTATLSLESIKQPFDISVQNANGDGAAATIGKFLVQGAESDQRPNPANQTNSPISTGATNSSHNAAPPAAPTANPSTTVANLLTSGASNADPIASTARLLNAGSRDGHHQATLQLDPPELGQLRIDIRMREAGMTLRVDAENAAAAKLIETRMPELKDALSVHGIRIERSEVVVRSTDTSNDQPAHRDARDSQSGFDQQSHQQSNWFDDRSSDSSRDHRAWSPSTMTDNVSAAAADAARWMEEFEPASYESVNLVA